MDHVIGTDKDRTGPFRAVVRAFGGTSLSSDSGSAPSRLVSHS
jgi:hypothetical protein